MLHGKAVVQATDVVTEMAINEAEPKPMLSQENAN